MKKVIFKILPLVLLFVGFGIVLYTTFTIQSTTHLVVGFSLVGVAMLIALPQEIMNIEKDHRNQKRIFNQVIELIKSGDHADAYKLCNEKIVNKELNAYAKGLIFGDKFVGDKFNELKY